MQKKLIDFSRYSSIKIGPCVEVNVIESEDELDIDGYLIGGANNLLLSTNPPQLKMLGKNFDFITIEDRVLRVGCATKTGRLLSFAKKSDIANLEFIAKLPGTIGGMVAMNAGVKSYEIFNIIKRVKINGVWVDKKDIEHGYRFAKLDGIATEVELILESGYSQELRDELIKLRNNQPKEPSAGSAFKNPPGDFAGRLIEAVGLKGVKVGNMSFSEVHANFLVNLGGGTYEDAISLINMAKKRVKKQFNIDLLEEIKIVDCFPLNVYNSKISTPKEYLEYLKSIGFKESAKLSEKKVLILFERIGIFRLKGYVKELKISESKTIDNIIFYYYFDRFFSKNLFDLTDKVESKVKAILVNKYYNATKNHFAYLIKDNHKWSNFKLDIPTVNNFKCSKHPINQKESYTHFIKFYLTNYNFVLNKLKYLHKKELIDIDKSINYPPFKYLIESATLGMTIAFINSLKINRHDIIKLVAKEFNINNTQNFKQYLLRLNEIRNRVSHGNRVFNRTYRSVKGVDIFRDIRKNINNHKLVDVYLFLIYLLNGLEGIKSYDDFKISYINRLFKEFKANDFYDKELNSFLQNIEDDNLKAVLKIMER